MRIEQMWHHLLTWQFSGKTWHPDNKADIWMPGRAHRGDRLFEVLRLWVGYEEYKDYIITRVQYSKKVNLRSFYTSRSLNLHLERERQRERETYPKWYNLCVLPTTLGFPSWNLVAFWVGRSRWGWGGVPTRGSIARSSPRWSRWSPVFRPWVATTE